MIQVEAKFKPVETVQPEVESVTITLDRISAIRVLRGLSFASRTADFRREVSQTLGEASDALVSVLFPVIVIGTEVYDDKASGEPTTPTSRPWMGRDFN